MYALGRKADVDGVRPLPWPQHRNAFAGD